MEVLKVKVTEGQKAALRTASKELDCTMSAVVRSLLLPFYFETATAPIAIDPARYVQFKTFIRDCIEFRQSM